MNEILKIICAGGFIYSGGYICGSNPGMNVQYFIGLGIVLIGGLLLGKFWRENKNGN